MGYSSWGHKESDTTEATWQAGRYLLIARHHAQHRDIHSMQDTQLALTELLG